MKTMKLLVMIGLLLTAFSLPLYAGVTDTTTCHIDTAQVNSDAVDLWQRGRGTLLAIGFPAALTSDTVFVQGRMATTGAWKNIYYLGLTGTKALLHVVVDLSDIVQLNRDTITGLPRYIRIVSDDPEACPAATPRRFTIYRGEL